MLIILSAIEDLPVRWTGKPNHLFHSHPAHEALNLPFKVILYPRKAFRTAPESNLKESSSSEKDLTLSTTLCKGLEYLVLLSNSNPLSLNFIILCVRPFPKVFSPRRVARLLSWKDDAMSSAVEAVPPLIRTTCVEGENLRTDNTATAAFLRHIPCS